MVEVPGTPVVLDTTALAASPAAALRATATNLQISAGDTLTALDTPFGSY